jgi:hypothetical protein
MADLVQQMRPWISQWLDEDICSGPARSADELLDRVLEDLDLSRRGESKLAGAKIDLSKCFDRCYWKRCCRIMLKMGMPETLAHAIGSFYKQLAMWVEKEGAVAQEPIHPKTLLLQGCPGSVVMMLADANNWIKAVKDEVPRIKAGAYFDDRTLWNTDDDCAEVLGKALKASKRYDDDAGWLWNEKKGQAFASDEQVKEEMQADKEVPIVGDFAAELELLGVTSKIAPGEHNVTRTRAAKKAKHQLKRIRIVAPEGKNRGKRLMLVRTLILPKLCWAGQWLKPDEKTLKNWSNDVEATINGWIIGRSPALAWSITGAKNNPEFMIDYGAVRHQLWRARRRREGKSASREGSRLDEVVAKWNWTQISEFRFRTPEGALDLERDGQAAIEQTCERAWQRLMWARDNRGAPSIGEFEMSHPVTTEHVEAAKGGKAMRRAAVGGTLDYRAVASMKKKEGRGGESLACMCGEPFPSRRHFMHECSAVAKPMLSDHKCDLEHGLGVRMAPLYRRARQRRRQVPVGLAGALAAAAAAAGGRAKVASDGGVEKPQHKWQRLGSWGVAVAQRTFSGYCLGIDQSTAAAELAGALAVLRAAADAKVTVGLYIDNKGVQKSLDRAMLGNLAHLPRHCFGDWAEVRELLTQMPPGSRAWWIPSHGKEKDSFVLPPGHSEEEMRRLNGRADEAATACNVRRWTTDRHAEAAAESGARIWARQALARLVSAEEQYLGIHFRDMEGSAS